MDDQQKSFDFLFGSWRGHHRRLEDRLTGCTKWVEFESTLVARPVWGGLANVDELDAPDTPWGHIQGVTLRLYDAKAGQWCIYWGNRDVGRLDPAMVGSFKDGVGEFYDQELFRGRSIYVRFIWSNISATTARWEQAFSDDGGKTWETNWVADFTRVA